MPVCSFQLQNAPVLCTSGVNTVKIAWQSKSVLEQFCVVGWRDLKQKVCCANEFKSKANCYSCSIFSTARFLSIAGQAAARLPNSLIVNFTMDSRFAKSAWVMLGALLCGLGL